MPRAVRQLSCDDYCEELLKMSFNRITSYVCLNHRHGLWRTMVTFAIKTCFKTVLPRVNLLQIALYVSQRTTRNIYTINALSFRCTLMILHLSRMPRNVNRNV